MFSISEVAAVILARKNPARFPPVIRRVRTCNPLFPDHLASPPRPGVCPLTTTSFAAAGADKLAVPLRTELRFGDIFSNVKEFEDRFYESVRSDIHIYARKGVSQRWHKFLCSHWDEPKIACPAVYHAEKRDKKEGPGWRLVTVESRHGQRCIQRRKAELANQAAIEAARNTPIQPTQVHARLGQEQTEHKPSMPTPPVSTEPSSSSPSPPPTSSAPQAGVQSDTSTLTTLSELAPAGGTEMHAPAEEDPVEVKAEPMEEDNLARPLAAVEAAKEDQPAMAEGSGTRNADQGKDGDSGTMDSTARSPAATIDDVRTAIEEVTAAVQEAQQQSTSTSRSTSPVEVAPSPGRRSGTENPKVSLKISLPTSAGQSPHSKKAHDTPARLSNGAVAPATVKPPLKRPHTPPPTVPSVEPSAETDESEPTPPSTPSQASDDAPYSPSHEVDDTVWTAPQPKPAKRPRRSGPADTPAGTASPSITSQVPEIQRRPKLREKEKEKRQTFPTSPMGKNKATAPTPSSRQSKERRARERESSPEIIVAASTSGPGRHDASGSGSKKHHKHRSSRNDGAGGDGGNSESKKSNRIKEWTATIAAPVPPEHRPAVQPALGDKALASIENFPRKVLAIFHALGVETTGHLTDIGVTKDDFPALLKHLKTLPEAVFLQNGEDKNFDEIEAWLAERRLMEL